MTTTTNEHLGATGGVLTTIAPLNLPPGRFVLHASGDLVNFGPSDFTRCQIFVAGTQVAAVSALVGDPTASATRARPGCCPRSRSPESRRGIHGHGVTLRLAT